MKKIVHNLSFEREIPILKKNLFETDLLWRHYNSQRIYNSDQQGGSRHYHEVGPYQL